MSGGWDNIAFHVNSVIGGGQGNTTSGADSTIGGGISNTIPFVGSLASIGGGADNTASGYVAAVGGGNYNTASSDSATVGGGGFNNASGDSSTVSGGNSNVASGKGAFIGGGGYDGTNAHGNHASGNASTISGGLGNLANNYGSVVGGGVDNTASGLYATVPGGVDNVASGVTSFAAGQGASTNGQPGAFVWTDDSTVNVLNATAANQFVARSVGGFYLWTNKGLSTGCSWSCTSDCNVKANFVSVNPRSILALVNALPIQSWNYKTQAPSIRHIGPMAQDFYAAFGIGEDNKHIDTVDASGVALAAIQGLYRENQDLKTQNAQLEARVSRLEQNAESSSTASPPAPFDVFNLLSVIALAGLGWIVIRQRKQQGGTR